MKGRLFIFFAILLLPSLLKAQSAVRADELFTTQEYQQAKLQYERLLTASPKNALYLYRYARCLQELGQTEDAIFWFEKAGERYNLRNFFIGILYAKTYRFDKAITSIEKYMSTIDESHERYKECVYWLNFSKKGIRYIKRVEDITFTDSINIGKKDWQQAYLLSDENGKITTDSLGVVFINAKNDRMIREQQVILPSADTCYQLFTSEWLLTEWVEQDTMPEPVNGNFNTRYPFMMSDGVTLYYATDSEDGLGGYDIYVTRYNPDAGWLAPENLGFPFNSSANDYLYAIDEQLGVGLFATDRFSTTDSLTVYTFVVNTPKRILRDTTEEYIRNAARLIEKRTLDTLKETLTENETPKVAERQRTQEILFQINDGTVYTRWQDFQSEGAMNLAKEYVVLVERLKEETQELTIKREHYRRARTEEQQQNLKAVILTQEQTLRTLNAERKSLIKQIRQLENQAVINR